MGFIAKRLGAALITLFLASILNFLVFSVIPGDPASLILGTGASAEQVAALRAEMGLNRSIPARYFDWLAAFFSGNLGNSVRYRGESISAMIQSRLPLSCALALLALLLILLIALPLSLLSAKREGGALCGIVNIYTAASMSVPGFFAGLLFIWIFGVALRLFSPGVFVSPRENFARFAGSLFFPALAIAIPASAVLVKFLRTSIFKELRKGYARAAMSRGASRSHVLFRHVMRNALVPSITVFCMIIAEIFSGSIVIEQVFAIPGTGRLLIAAVSSRDYPLIQTLTFFIALVVIAANLLADIAIQIIDPRIRLDSSSPL